MKSIKKAQIKDKTVILRVDYNITLDAYGKIIDDVKIRASLPTIRHLIKYGAKRIIIISHMGRPIVRKGAKIDEIVRGNSGLILKPVAMDLAKRLKIKYKDIKAVKNKDFFLPFYKISSKIWLMENIRFDCREEKNDVVFAKELASLGDVYVDDAFANAHRQHASMVGIANNIPSYAGILFEKEIRSFEKVISKPTKPFVLVMGGAKVDEKIKILKKLAKKTDKIVLGGVLANTFLVSRDIDMKASKYDKESVPLASEIYGQFGKKIYLPMDLVWKGNMAVDIGKNTQKQYASIILKAKTVFWNGTMGLTSLGNFKYAAGTKAIIEAIVKSSAKDKVVCGGDTIGEVDKMGMISKMTHASTGGGAALAYLAGEKLPALEVLEKNK